MPKIGFNDRACTVPELAPFKLQTNGAPSTRGRGHWWYLVVNFNSLIRQSDARYVRACLRLANDNDPKSKPEARSALCKVIGDVTINTRRGIADFNGGYLICEGINIGAAGTELGIDVGGTAKITESFWVAVKGTLAADGGGPLLRYEPKESNADTPGSIALNLTPVGAGQRAGFITTAALNSDLQGAGMTIGVRPALPFTGLFETTPAYRAPANPVTASLIYGWSLFGAGLTDATLVSALSTKVGISDSTLYIGGLPSGERFRGTLDFIVLDPRSGGRTD